MQYLADCVQTVAQSSGRTGLRSVETADYAYATPGTRTECEERGFRFAGDLLPGTVSQTTFMSLTLQGSSNATAKPVSCLLSQ